MRISIRCIQTCLFPIIGAILFLSGCEQISNFTGGSLNEGVITYDVKFTSIAPGSMSAGLMPQQITRTFKGHLSRIDMNVGHGMMKSSYISNSKTMSMIIIVELFGSRFATVQNKEKTGILISKLPVFSLQHSNESKVIAGFECHKTTVSDAEGKVTFDIFHTDDIQKGNLNWDNPFREIRSTILEYPLTYKFGKEVLDMELVASKVEATIVEDKLFKVPKGCEMVSKEQIDKMLEDLMAMGK